MARTKNSVFFERDDRLFKALIENSWDVVLLIDAKARVLYASPSIIRLFGRDYSEFIGINGIKYIHPADAPRIAKMLTQLVLTPRKSIKTEMRIKHKAGNYLWVEAIASNLLSDENVKGIVVNFHDISALKKNEEKKDEFISIASHELKSPITSLKIYLQIIQRGIERMSTEKIQEIIQKMADQVDRLERLVADLYDTARIREGKLPFKKESFLLLPLIKEIAEDTERNFGSHKITIRTQFRGSVVADKMRIHQVLVNLLSNAVKFSPKASKINIMVWKKGKFIFISVTDYGIGISKENLSKITMRFFQAEDNTKRVSGLGLGLYIVYNIVNQHGGVLSIKSTLGKSTTVTCSFPKGKKGD